MDLLELVDILNNLGVTAKNAQIHSNYLQILEEKNQKIQSILRIIEKSGTDLSSPEIQVYEHYINNLTLQLFEENTLTAFKLISQIEQVLFEKSNQAKQDNSEQDKRKQYKNICRTIRTQLVQNKDILNTFEQYWTILYRLMKYEELF